MFWSNPDAPHRPCLIRYDMINCLRIRPAAIARFYASASVDASDAGKRWLKRGLAFTRPLSQSLTALLDAVNSRLSSLSYKRAECTPRLTIAWVRW